jgi:succinyl-CoA synthetase alpha subunit
MKRGTTWQQWVWFRDEITTDEPLFDSVSRACTRRDQSSLRMVAVPVRFARPAVME